MHINRFKNILITALVFLALYSTSAIWFEDTGGNFLTLFARTRHQIADIYLMRSFAFPMRIVTGDGSHDFHISYSGMSDNVVRAFGDEVLLSALSQSYAPRTAPPDFGEILAGRLIIYEYAFELPSDEFSRALGLPQSPPPIPSFNRIIFFPAELGLNVYFHNRNTGAWAGYTATDKYFQEGFAALSNSLQSSSNILRWNSSFLLGFDPNPHNNLFIPVWYGESYYYPVGEARIAHFDPAVVGSPKSTIRTNLMSFFDNPAAVYDASIGRTFAWADENTIVRYFHNNVIQYISYRRDLRNTELLEDFAAALDFMARRDVFLTNDFFLSGFEERNNERVFYFDYILEGLPVIFSDALRNGISDQTENGITVRFRDGSLVSYTRLAYEFTVNTALVESANRDLPLYILNSGLDMESLESITLAFAAPRVDIVGAGIMNLWVDFRMWDGMSSMESLNTNPD